MENSTVSTIAQTRQFCRVQILAIKQAPHLVLITYIAAEMMCWVGSKLCETAPSRKFIQQFPRLNQKFMSTSLNYLLSAAGAVVVNQALGRMLPYPLALAIATLPSLRTYIVTSIKSREKNEELKKLEEKSVKARNEELKRLEKPVEAKHEELQKLEELATSIYEKRNDFQKEVTILLDTTRSPLAEKNKTTLEKVRGFILSLSNEERLLAPKPEHLTARGAILYLTKYMETKGLEKLKLAKNLLSEFEDNRLSYSESIEEKIDSIIEFTSTHIDVLISSLDRLKHLKVPKSLIDQGKTLKKYFEFVEGNSPIQIQDHHRDAYFQITPILYDTEIKRWEQEIEQIQNAEEKETKQLALSIWKILLNLEILDTVSWNLQLANHAEKIRSEGHTNVIQRIGEFESGQSDEDICWDIDDFLYHRRQRLIFLTAKTLQRDWKDEFQNENEKEEFYQDQVNQNADFIEKQRYSSATTKFKDIDSDEMRNEELDRWEADIARTEDVQAKVKKQIAFFILKANSELNQLSNYFEEWQKQYPDLAKHAEDSDTEEHVSNDSDEFNFT